MILRDERPDDADTLHTLTFEAFKPMAFSDDSEANALRKLRADGDLVISLVAEEAGDIIGHAAFSPARFANGVPGWYALGPISVRNDRQRQGIGRALIAEGLARLRAMEASGCVLLGNPEVYASSGFVSDGRLTYKDVAVKYVQHVLFSGPPPDGEVTFAPGLD